MKILYTFISGVILVFLPSQKSFENHPMSGIIDVASYHLKIHIDEADSTLAGIAGIQFTAVKATGTIQFNLEEMTVDACLLNGNKVSYYYDKGFIRIKCPFTLIPGNTYNVQITWHGKPADGLIIKKNKYGNFCVFADNWPDRARYWFPCADYPGDKAAVSFDVTVPEKYEVIANGKSQGRRSLPGAEAGYFYSTSVPVPTYCMVIGVCDFSITRSETRTGIPVYYYSYPEDSLQAVRGFKRVPDMVGFYDSLIGPYPFSKLALVESSTVYGGMENSSAIFLPEEGPSYTGKRNNDETLAHEIAHQWFGDDVTEKDFPELWLSEGFATYFSMLYFESREGENKMEALIKRAVQTYKKRSKGKVPVIYDRYESPVDLLSVENYQKGALFLHALRKYIGDDMWFAGIREYYNRFKHGNATTGDFREIMEQVSGRDLTPIFHRWLNRPGLPENDLPEGHASE